MTAPKYPIEAVCRYCGPHFGLRTGAFEPACPTCRLDPGEVRMVEQVISLGFEECYRREYRRDHGLPL